MKHELIIIGGGASGLIAAITAKDLGIDCAILEATDRIGKKILTTGNGRCNIGNNNISINRYHSEVTDFPIHTLNSFPVDYMKDLFNTLGLPLVTLEGGKMYPMSLQASSVVDMLFLAIEERNIPVYLNCKAKDLETTKYGFNILVNNEENYECNKLIIATGGKSYPKTGSDGSGYKLAEKLGHKIVPPLPSLVQVKLNHNKLKALSGIKFDGFAEILINAESQKKEFGEILFTDYGISGIPVLQLSRLVSYHSSLKPTNINITLKIDMLPDINRENLSEFLENHWGTFGYRSVTNSLIGIINKKLIPILLKEAGVSDIHKPCWNLTWDEKKNVMDLLKGWTFDVCGTNSFSSAQVTSGGIDVSLVNPKTLESTLIPNLYFAGEILDVDGDCGGFNLYWAWGSGVISAKNACAK